MPDTKITMMVECPDCEVEFDAEIEAAELVDDSEEGITFECPDCDCEFVQAYDYDPATGALTMGVVLEVLEEDDDEEEDDG